MAQPDRPHDEVVQIDKMAAGGDAIAHLADGRVVFFDGALPDEVVCVGITTNKRDFAKGLVLEVVQPSSHRVAPPCPEIPKGCGGCGWQHAEPLAQLQWKTAVVADAMRRTAKLPDADIRIGGSVPPWGYRTSMRLAVTAHGRVGLRSASSHHVVALETCMVAHPALAALLPAVRIAGGEELSVRVSVATGEATAWSSTGSVRVDGLAPHVALGRDSLLFEDVAGVRLRVTAASFFQSGPAAAELLVTTVKHACGDALLNLRGPLLDAYGGIGLFAATLGTEEVVVVESSPSSCADAVVNLGDRATVHQTQFEGWTPQPVELAIVDPARTGLGPAAIDVLAATNAQVVVLVSCDPVSLARDTALLAARGYRHERSTVLDLFPQTPHVEVVTRFERA